MYNNASLPEVKYISKSNSLGSNGERADSTGSRSFSRYSYSGSRSLVNEDDNSGDSMAHSERIVIDITPNLLEDRVDDDSDLDHDGFDVEEDDVKFIQTLRFNSFEGQLRGFRRQMKQQNDDLKQQNNAIHTSLKEIKSLRENQTALSRKLTHIKETQKSIKVTVLGVTKVQEKQKDQINAINKTLEHLTKSQSQFNVTSLRNDFSEQPRPTSRPNCESVVGIESVVTLEPAAKKRKSGRSNQKQRKPKSHSISAPVNGPVPVPPVWSVLDRTNCPHCGKDLTSAYLKTHVISSCPVVREKAAVENSWKRAAVPIGRQTRTAMRTKV